jgi:hypothetical protein
MYFELSEIFAFIVTLALPYLCESYTKYQEEKINRRIQEEDEE